MAVGVSPFGELALGGIEGLCLQGMIGGQMLSGAVGIQDAHGIGS